MSDSFKSNREEINSFGINYYQALQKELLDKHGLECETKDVETVVDGVSDGLIWVMRAAGVENVTFSIGVAELANGGAATVVTQDVTAVILAPQMFAATKEARLMAQEADIDISELIVDITIVKDLPQITLPFNEMHKLQGVAEGVHIVQRLVALGEITNSAFEPMDGPSEQLTETTSLLDLSNKDPNEYMADPLEQNEKEWVNKYFQEKFGDDNPYVDFYNAFRKHKKINS